MKVVTVHGIRRQHRWDEDFAALPELKNHNIEVVNFDYGYFSIWKFLTPSKRDKIVVDFCRFYSEHFKDSDELPSVIAHSFGTYVVFSALEKYDVIKFDTIIFCGSILYHKLDFRYIMASNQVGKIYNDHGKFEWFLKITRYIINKKCGKAGKVGFLDIPPKYKDRIINRENFKAHSDYFLPMHMSKNWLPQLIHTDARFIYSTEILRNEVIDRIYQNINKDKNDFNINEIFFNVRVDELGNYFAKYEKKGINEKNYVIDEMIFSTTADGFHHADDMNFVSFDEHGVKNHTSINNDKNHLKEFKIKLNKAISPKESIYIKNYFCWYNTINLKTGDTDHWSIKNIRNISISINFPSELVSPKIFEIKDKKIIGQHKLEKKTEKNKTISYYTNYINDKNCDGLIFYFEGYMPKIHNTQKKPNEFSLLGRKDKYLIERASEKDIKQVYKIELDVEHGNAATEETLIKRRLMFPDGFLVVKNKKNNAVIGYIESLIWNEKKFEEFSEISNFPLHFNINGNTLYIIFIAITSKFRKKGLGYKLIKEIEAIAKQYNIDRISLVAKDDLYLFYEKLGYSVVRELPNFLKGRTYKSLLMEKRFV